MSDETDLTLDYNEAPLSPDQISQIEAISDQVRDALAELGAAHTEHQQAYSAYSATMRHMKSCEQVVAMVQQQHDAMMAAMAKSMDLPPGDWIYDRPTGTLKKEPGNG